MREIRRKDRALAEEEAMAILDHADYGFLSTASENGTPYGVPLNYCIIGHCIYFHCALNGHKIDNINKNSRVSFCVVGKTEIKPDEFGTNYESVIVSGEIDEVFDLNKQLALEGLLHKYSNEYFNQGLQYIESLRDKVKVFRITIHALSGKSRMQ